MDNQTNKQPEILERFRELENETRITLVLKDIFGNPFDFRATYTGVVEQHGYFTRGGGWALRESKGTGDIPCYRISVRPYRKRREIWLQLGSKVIDYRLGWVEDGKQKGK